MGKRTASCHCGALRVTCSGEPALVSLCNCTACQKRTGSTFGIAAFFEDSDISSDGPYSSFVRPSDSGHDVAFFFCPTCGSTVFWKPSRKPQWTAVAAGAFADPDFPAPDKAVYERRKPKWISYAIDNCTD